MHLCFLSYGNRNFASIVGLERKSLLKFSQRSSCSKSNLVDVSMTYLPRHMFLALASLFVATDVSWGIVEKLPKSKLDLPVFISTGSGLQYFDIKIGSGNVAAIGSRVTFHYIGRLAGRQGKPFEDTYADEPYRIVLGKDKIIPGLEQGLLGMREGGKRRLLIPSALGYSDRQA